MSKQRTDIIDTLTQWSQINPSISDSDDKSDLKPCELARRIYQIGTANRGIAQQMPSHLLQPV